MKKQWYSHVGTFREIELNAARTGEKSLSSRAPGITYNVAKCKQGYGVYVQSLSGQALADLCTLFPGMRVDADPNSPTYGSILFQGTPIEGGVRVNSNRIATASSEKEGLRIINQLKAQSERKQINKLFKVRMWLVNRDKVLVKGKYYQFSREILGTMRKVGTSQDKAKLEKLASDYTHDGIKVKLTGSVTRTKVLHPSQTEEVWDAERKRIYSPVTAGMELTPYVPAGIQGMCKPIKQLGVKASGAMGTTGEWARRISQKRKRTTKVSFFNKWR